MELIKQSVNVFAAPLPVALILAVSAAACSWRARRRAALSLLGLAAAIVFLGGTVTVGNALLRPLEDSYQPLAAPLPQVNYIVVLGSGYSPRAGLPISAALDEQGLRRIVEGIILSRRIPNSKLIVSGGAPLGRVPPALGYARLAVDLGVPPSAIVVLDGGRDTYQEANAVVARVGSGPFILVTSADHMPRAMWLMRHVGANPIAAPTGQIADLPSGEGAGPEWLPSSGGLLRVQLALHEYLGLAAARLGVH